MMILQYHINALQASAARFLVTKLTTIAKCKLKADFGIAFCAFFSKKVAKKLGLMILYLCKAILLKEKFFRKEVTTMKKIVALLLALTLCLTLFAACGGEGSQEETKGAITNSKLENYKTPDLTGAELTMYAWDNADYDPEGSWQNQAVEKVLGCNLNIVELPSFSQQYTTMLAEKNVPDLTFGSTYNNTYTQFGEDGAYINIYNYLDMMPNVKAYLENPDNASKFNKFIVREGVMYCLPVIQEADTAPYTFLYRKDIFDANGLTFPTNQEEFVATLRKLKELYPSSYPLSMRSLAGHSTTVTSWGFLWGESHVMSGHHGTIMNLGEDGKYSMTLVSEAYKEMAKFFLELTQEGLMHPSCATMDTATWQETFASDTSFITWDKTDRLPSINIAGQSMNPDFQMIAAAPFNFGEYAKTSDVVTTSRKAGIGSGSGYWHAIGDNENTAYSVAYIDWLYSEEGKTVTNWGIEGESYTVDENGNKDFIDSFIKEQGGITSAGLNTLEQVGVRMEDAYVASLTELEKESLELAQQFTGKGTAQHKLNFNEEEQFIYDTYATALYNYGTEQWTRFVLGQRDFAEWDNVLEEMKRKYHYDELLKIHEDALVRTLEENGMS